MGPDLDLDRKHQTPTLSHHTPQFSLKIKGLTFLTLAQKSLKYSLLSNIIITFYQDHRFKFLAIQSRCNPSIKSPRRTFKLKKGVAHAPNSRISTLLLAPLKPSYHPKYHHNSTLGYLFFAAQGQGRDPLHIQYPALL